MKKYNFHFFKKEKEVTTYHNKQTNYYNVVDLAPRFMIYLFANYFLSIFLKRSSFIVHPYVGVYHLSCQ